MELAPKAALKKGRHDVKGPFVRYEGEDLRVSLASTWRVTADSHP